MLPQSRAVRVAENHPDDGWYVNATATDAEAAATKAAESDKTHYLTGVLASVSDASAGGDLSVEIGGVEQFVINVPAEGLYVEFPVPVAADENEAVAAKLAAQGAGVDGRVTIFGFTL